MQHRTSGLEDLLACSEGVVANIVPWKFSEEGDEGFVSALGGALGVVGLRGGVSTTFEGAIIEGYRSHLHGEAAQHA